jgi:hypothetical protein
MPIRTTANTYSRGAPKNNSNFFLVAQSNRVIPSPTATFLKANPQSDRNVGNIYSQWITYPWRK